MGIRLIIVILILLRASHYGFAQTNPWTVKVTGASHTILIATSSNPSIDGVPLQNGDVIGVFYDSLGKEVCGGLTTWNSFDTLLTAYGNFGTINGFATGEIFRFKIWKSADNCIVNATPSFKPVDNISINATNTFVIGAVSKLDSLKGRKASFSYPNSSLCLINGTIQPVFTGGPVSGIYRAAPIGLSINSITGFIDTNKSSAKSFDVNLTTFSCLISNTFNFTLKIRPEIYLPADTIICTNTTATLSVVYSGDLLWSTGETTQQIFISKPGKYSVTATGVNGCTDSEVVRVKFNTIPGISLGNDRLICEGEKLVLTVLGISNSYLWSNGATSNNIEVTAGTYWVTTNNSQCKTSDTINIIKRDFNIENLVITVKSECNKNGHIQIEENAITGGKAPFTYSLINTLSGQGINNSTNNFDLPDGKYDLYVKDSYGCTLLYKLPVYISRTKNCDNPILAPDATGQLGSFFIPYAGSVKIYDKSGQLIKHIYAPANWDGTDNNGNIVSMGDYYLICDCDKTTIVTVLR